MNAGLPEHRRRRPHLSLLELQCPCCQRLIVPSLQPHACNRHPWGSARRYLVGWFCGDCCLPLCILRLFSRDDPAYEFLATLDTAAHTAWEHGHLPDLPAWILPPRGPRRAALRSGPATPS